VVASVLCRHTTTSIAAAHEGWRASSIPQGVVDGDRDAGQDVTRVQDGGVGGRRDPNGTGAGNRSLLSPWLIRVVGI
jgi:hypothetical protein